MRHFEYRRLSPVLFLTAIFIITASIPLWSLDFSLNGRNLAVMDNAALQDFAHNSVIPLSALYPWMQSVDSLEVQSGINRVYWDNWDDALLVYQDGIWEVHTGRDIFSNPDRISVHGDRLNVESISIWSAINNPDFKNDLLSALAFRDVNVDWLDITQPGLYLSDPPSEGLPQLILLDQLNLIRLKPLLSSYHQVSGRVSEWISNSADPGNPQGIELPMAVDAYHGEAALLFLLAENPDLFDDEGRIPDSLAEFFDWAASIRKSSLIITKLPVAALTSGTSHSAVRLPSSMEPHSPLEAQFSKALPPEGSVNIIRVEYAAIPMASAAASAPALAGDSSFRIIAELVLEDTVRAAIIPEMKDAVPIPVNPEIIRYFDAYERIGRLAISGQLDSREALRLINQYINDENSGE